MSAAGARAAFPANWWLRAGWVCLAAYVAYAAARLDFTWERFVVGIDHGARFIGRMIPPVIAQPDSLANGLIESLQIALLASFLGIVISLPIGLLAARNLMPVWATWPARMAIALCRSFHPVIVAILFVKAVGFGAMAGILALVVASIGFIGKLFAEAIEEISLKQVEAVRATGAPFMNVITYGVLPQVFTRFIGFATYQLDSNLRNSTMVGIVISLPVGLMASRNLMPVWATWPARTAIALCRSFHPVIVAIIFVKAVGFGAMAGILALMVASVGFIGKLFAEAIEEISLKQVEAVRATGASFLNVITYGVLPQVFTRFIGFATYQLDSNLRNSTMVGIVGAGGIGGTLFSAFQRFDYDFVAAILLSIIAMIMVGEVLAGWVRGVFLERGKVDGE